MKKNIVSILLILICTFSMTACNKTKPNDLGSESKSEVIIQSEIQSGDSSAKEDENKQTEAESLLTVSEARRIAAETIDENTYLILDGKTNLQIGTNKYHTFIIANKSDNTALGQIAVDCKTGEKFNYKGEDVIEDYSNFKLYNPKVDMKVSWEGTFTDGTRTLEFLPMDDKSFEYMIDDGEDGGIAQVTGNTANDISRDVTFTYGEDGSITVSGEITGVFTR